jgi:hypothetical protein
MANFITTNIEELLGKIILPAHEPFNLSGLMFCPLSKQKAKNRIIEIKVFVFIISSI